jgi:hypothetical protein
MLKRLSLPHSNSLLRFLAVVLCVGLLACDASEETGETISLNCAGEADTGSTTTITIQGYVKDGADGTKLSGTVNLYNSTGTTLLNNSSVSSSKYSFSGLKPSTYIIKAVVSDYASVADTQCLTESNTGKDFIVLKSSKTSNANVIVLTWGDSNSGAPSDLDSHLKASGGSPVDNSSNSLTHVYYSVKSKTDNTTWAMLDTDATNYSGPETITINLENSTFKDSVAKVCYYVHIWRTGYSFSQTKAQVQLFQSNGTVLTNFDAPTDTTYTSKPYWHVFDLDSNLNITTKNTVSSSAPSCS